MDRIPDSKNADIAKKPKKKKHIGLFIALGIIVVLIAAPIGTVYGCFYDGTRNEITKDENFNIENVMGDLAVDSLDSTNETGKISFAITKDIINQMLIKATDEIYKTAPALEEYFTSLSLETYDNKWVFVGDLNAKNIFKTRVKIFTSFERDEENKRFIFEINDIKLGRINGLYNVVNDLAAKLGLNINDYIGTMVGSFGLSFQYDSETKQIYYSDEDARKDILHYLGENSSLYTALFTQYFDDEAFTISFDNNGIEGGIDLSNYTNNEKFLTPEKSANLNISGMRDIAEKMFNDGVIEYTDANVIDTYALLVSGYNSTTSAYRDLIKDVDLTKYGIADATTFEGITPKASDKDYIKNKVNSQVSLEGIATGYIGEINEDDIYQALLDTNVIGNSYLLNRKVEENNYKINYYALNDFYANVVDNHIYLVIGITVNGYQTNVEIDAKYLSCDPDNYTITFDINDIYYGENVVSGDFKSQIFTLLANGTKNNESVRIDKEQTQMIIDISSSLEETDKAAINLYGKMGVEITGSTLQDNGIIKFVINKNS